MADAASQLTEQQRRFVAEYVADPRSATRAYQRAFNHPPTHTTSRNLASALMKDPHIQAALAEAREEWARSLRISFRSMIRKLASIALADPDDYFEPDAENGGLPKPRPWVDIPATARKNIKNVKIKRRKLKGADDCLYELEEFEYKVVDQEWALGKLCEYLGVTKGSLTADELRSIIAGTHTPQPPAGLLPHRPSGAEERDPADGADVNPDAVRPERDPDE